MSLQYDPQKAIRSLRRKDKTLAALIKAIGEFRLAERSSGTPFKSLFRAIVYQQLSTKAAGAIHSRVMELYANSKHPKPEQILETADEILRGAGLSRNKTLAVKDLAAKTLDKTVPSRQKLNRMQDEEIIERLVSVRGVGRWTAEMLLIFELGRPDVLPVSDLGVRKGYKIAWNLDELPDPNTLLEYGEIWRPYRSVASWYLWRATDSLPA